MDDYSGTISTQKSFTFLVVLGQYLQTLPTGVSSRKKHAIWNTFNFCCSAFLSVISLIQLTFSLIFLMNQEDKFLSSSSFVYVLTVAIYKVLFVHLARKWKYFLQPWFEIDACMEQYQMVENFEKKMKAVIIVFMVFAVGEHIFFMCSQDIITSEQSFEDGLDTYFHLIFNYVFFILPYNRYAAIIFQILNWLFTLTWTFADIYLIVLVIPLTFRFRQIKEKINYLIQNKVKEIEEWKAIRYHFYKISELCEHTESYMTYILVVSFGNKLYVVLYQLLGFIKEHRNKTFVDESGLFHRIYFGISFAIILGRLVSVTWFTAAIDTESQEIAQQLFSVPSEIYNDEVERFVLHITLNPPILSGLKVFYMRKSLILKIATSIIVYELVLMQFQIKTTII